MKKNCCSIEHANPRLEIHPIFRRNRNGSGPGSWFPDDVVSLPGSPPKSPEKIRLRIDNLHCFQIHIDLATGFCVEPDVGVWELNKINAFRVTLLILKLEGFAQIDGFVVLPRDMISEI